MEGLKEYYVKLIHAYNKQSSLFNELIEFQNRKVIAIDEIEEYNKLQDDHNASSHYYRSLVNEAPKNVPFGVGVLVCYNGSCYKVSASSKSNGIITNFNIVELEGGDAHVEDVLSA